MIDPDDISDAEHIAANLPFLSAPTVAELLSQIRCAASDYDEIAKPLSQLIDKMLRGLPTAPAGHEQLETASADTYGVGAF